MKVRRWLFISLFLIVSGCGSNRVKEPIEVIYEDVVIEGKKDRIDLSKEEVEMLKGMKEGKISIHFKNQSSGRATLISANNSKDVQSYLHLYVDEASVGFEVRNKKKDINIRLDCPVILNEENNIVVEVQKQHGTKIMLNGAEICSTKKALFFHDVKGVDRMVLGKTMRKGVNGLLFRGELQYVKIENNTVIDK